MHKNIDDKILIFHLLWQFQRAIRNNIKEEKEPFI